MTTIPRPTRAGRTNFERAMARTEAPRLPNPEHERIARLHAMTMAQDPGNRWRGMESLLREARELVTHAVSGGGA